MTGIDEAFELYQNHILDEEKIDLLRGLNLKVAGVVPSVIWEAFGATLTGQQGNGFKGADLVGWEVKSAIAGSSYEYQYHLNTGAEKLADDCSVNHLFCAYSRDYRNLSVWAMRGCDLSEKYFNSWSPRYADNYSGDDPSKRRQRFRCNIPSGHVASNGELILRIEDGKIRERHDDVLQKFCGP